MSVFTKNQKVAARSACDNNCIFTATILQRTPKTVTIKIQGETKRCKIHNYGDGESIFPLGQYSMAPIFNA